MNMPELLAPAGSLEGVRAAVQSGASAVYMGYGMFHARRGAKGFSQEEMAEAIAYCRLRGVKSNITFNIVASDREIDAAMQDARFLYEAGADALIVQDIGVAQLLHRHAPDLALHASTQLTVHTLDGARAARELGFSRVVLSRECSEKQVRLIAAQGGIETEVFVHGALCMCYSGQCYLSSVIGQRSGNRGLCAQPCRLPYNGGHPLSLKDLSLADYIPALADMGVASLKIEGRMKRAEYTAIVTGIYAALLREHRAPTEAERETLRRVFSRDGFTDGYFTGKVDAAMLGTKTEVPLHEVQALYDQAAHRFAPGCEAPLVPVRMAFCASADKGASLTVEGCTVHAPVQQAHTRETSAETVKKALEKTGGTPFYVSEMKIDLENGLMLPASVLNALRREALAQVSACRSAPAKRRWTAALSRKEPAQTQSFVGYTASVRTLEQAQALAGLSLQTVYVPLAVAAETGMPAVLPRVFSDAELPDIERLLTRAKQKGTDTLLIGNLGHLPLARRFGLRVHGDFGLNAYNSASLCALAESGIARQTLSFELHVAQIRELCAPIETELLVYGYLPLMIFENCAIRGQHKGQCACKQALTYLTDRKEQRFALLPEFGCRNTLFNSRPLSLRDDPARQGVTHARLHLTIETPEACVRIARAFLSGNPPEGEFTNGLYHRGAL